jgi:endonuclease III
MTTRKVTCICSKCGNVCEKDFKVRQSEYDEDMEIVVDGHVARICPKCDTPTSYADTLHNYRKHLSGLFNRIRELEKKND